MIEIRDVSHAFQDRTVLAGVNVTLDQHRIGIIGPNGGGKSTFARLLNGLLIPDQGTVRVDDFDTRRDPRKVRQRVGFVFQNPDSQIVMPTVEEDLAFGLGNVGLKGQILADRVTQTLEEFNLAPFRSMPAHRLSGGQKQLLALAGVVAMQPVYLVLDEPTTLLDLRNSRIIHDRLAMLAQNVILISHDLNAFTGFDRLLLIADGSIVAEDAPAAVIAHYRRHFA